MTSPLRARKPVILGTLLLALSLAAATLPQPAWQGALDHISAASLRGHLSFIASDALEGRDTPSRGLDIAAEYIAAQFRRAGLDPGGDDGYFQTANLRQVEQNLEGFELKLGDVNVDRDKVRVRTARALQFDTVPLVWAEPGALSKLTREQVQGKVLATEAPARSGFRNVIRAVRVLEPALLLLVDREPMRAEAARVPLVDPEERAASGTPSITVHDATLLDKLAALKPGPTGWSVFLRLPAPLEKSAKVRNVIGILRGSDPALKDTCVLLSAHYDHLGVAAAGEADRIYNGANDDGSGTVSVIEIGDALARLPQHPKRTIVFATFFGEEKGSLGAQYYARHPACPLEKTVADVNLEQLGRTDSSDGPQISNATFTGFDYSNLAAVFQKAGDLTGVRVYKAGGDDSDSYYSRSDNQTFADRGIPASTVCVTFVYPDYHAVGDEWNKIDYDNMAKVDRMLALGTLMLANSPAPPNWDESNAKTARYVEAWKKLHPAVAAGRP